MHVIIAGDFLGVINLNPVSLKNNCSRNRYAQGIDLNDVDRTVEYSRDGCEIGSGRRPGNEASHDPGWWISCQVLCVHVQTLNGAARACIVMPDGRYGTSLNWTPLNCPTKLAPPKMECPLGPTTLLLWGPCMSMLNYNATHWGPHSTVKMGPPRRQHLCIKLLYM